MTIFRKQQKIQHNLCNCSELNTFFSVTFLPIKLLLWIFFYKYHVCINHNQSLFKSVHAKSKTVFLRLGPCFCVLYDLQLGLLQRSLLSYCQTSCQLKNKDGQEDQFYESYIRDVIFWAIDIIKFLTQQCVVHLNFGRNVWKCVWSVFRSNQTRESGAGKGREEFRPGLGQMQVRQASSYQLR